MTTPSLHPEIDRALHSIERATNRRLPDLRAVLALLPPEAQSRAVRDLYSVSREVDSLNSTVSRARRMGGMLVPGMR